VGSVSGPPPTATHPLDPLTVDEIALVREVLHAAGHVTAATRFPDVTLDEPDPERISAGTARRAARAVLLDTETGAIAEAVVSLDDRTPASYEIVASTSAPYGQPTVMAEEHQAVERIAKADPGYRAALARRGVADLGALFVAPLAPGQFGLPHEAGRRALRALAFLRHSPQDSPWAHPVWGLVATVDLVKGANAFRARRTVPRTEREAMRRTKPELSRI
jgi:primary-amine oxidase